MDQAKASLLGLPREVRNTILAYLLFNTRKDPISPLFPDKRIKGPQGIMLPSRMATSRRCQLLRVNQQLRAEAHEQIGNLYKTGNAIIEVDIMVKGYQLWPSWTHLPIIPQRGKYADMKVQLRIFSTESFQPGRTWPGVVPRDPGSGLRGLYTLLNMFLRHGTSNQWSQGPITVDEEAYRIDILTVRVVFVDIYTPDTWSNTLAEIVAKLKVFAASGIPYPYVRKVRLACDYEQRNEHISVRHEWAIKERSEAVPLDDWEGACVHFYGRPGP